MQLEYVLSETLIEERDGAKWVSGVCPPCWERFAFRAPPPGRTMRVWCPNGHLLLIKNQHSARVNASPEEHARTPR